MDLNYRIESQDRHDKIYFSGHINEDAEECLADLAAKLAPACTINFKEVKSINSCGVRAWINFIRILENGRTIEFEECPPEVVSQINMIPNFKGNSSINSVYATYSCENCDLQNLHLFKKGLNLPKAINEVLPEVTCPNCSETMEMEELEEEFFNWIEAG